MLSTGGMVKKLSKRVVLPLRLPASAFSHWFFDTCFRGSASPGWMLLDKRKTNRFGHAFRFQHATGQSRVHNVQFATVFRGAVSVR